MEQDQRGTSTERKRASHSFYRKACQGRTGTFEGGGGVNTKGGRYGDTLGAACFGEYVGVVRILFAAGALRDSYDPFMLFVLPVK
jgi:hypothetical protein